MPETSLNNTGGQMMNNQNHESLDEKLSRLYQQRKQQLTTPEAIATQAAKSAKQAKKQAHKHPLRGWLSRPLWASTVTTCFVITLSYYWLPVEPKLNDTQLDTSLVDTSLVDASLVNGVRVYNLQMDNATPVSNPDNLMAAPPIMADESASDEAAPDVLMRPSAPATDALPSRQSNRSEVMRTAKRQTRAEMADNAVSDAFKPTVIIPATTTSAKDSSALSIKGNAHELLSGVAGSHQSKPFYARVMSWEEQPNKPQPWLFYAKDCAGNIIEFSKKQRPGLHPNDWVKVKITTDSDQNRQVTVLGKVAIQQPRTDPQRCIDDQ
jgi:hypothetical protein